MNNNQKKENFLKADNTINLPEQNNFNSDEHSNLVEEFKNQYDKNKYVPFSRGLGVTFSYEELNSFMFSPYRMDIKIMAQLFSYLGYMKLAENFDDSWGFLIAKTCDIKKKQQDLMSNLKIDDQNQYICRPVQKKSIKQTKFAIIIQFDIKYVPILIFMDEKQGFVVDYNNTDITHASKMGIFAFNILKQKFQLFQSVDNDSIEWNTETQKLDKQVSDLSVSTYMFLHVALVHQNISDAKSFKFQAFALPAEQRGYFKKAIEWLLFKLRAFDKPDIEVLRPQKEETEQSSPEQSESEKSIKKSLSKQSEEQKKSELHQNIAPEKEKERTELGKNSILLQRYVKPSKDNRQIPHIKKEKRISLASSSIYSLPQGDSDYLSEALEMEQNKVYIKRPRNKYYDNDQIDDLQKRYEDFNDFRNPYAKNMLRKLKQLDVFFDKDPQEIQELADQNPELRQYIENIQRKLSQNLPKDESMRIIKKQHEEINRLRNQQAEIQKIMQQNGIFTLPNNQQKTEKIKDLMQRISQIEQQLQVNNTYQQVAPKIINQLEQLKNQLHLQLQEQNAIEQLNNQSLSSLPLLAMQQNSMENIQFRNQFIRNAPNILNIQTPQPNQQQMLDYRSFSTPQLPVIPNRQTAKFVGLEQPAKFNHEDFKKDYVLMGGRMHKKYNKKPDMVAYRYAQEIYRFDIQDMVNLQYLPEKIMNFILGYIVEKHYSLVRMEALIKKQLRFYIFPTDFYSSLTNNDLSSKKIYLQKVVGYSMNQGQFCSIFKFDQIIFPLFYSTIGEYAFCICDMKEKTIDFFEIGLNEEISQSQVAVLKNLHAYFQKEYEDFYKCSYDEIPSFKLYKGKCQRVEKSNHTGFYLLVYIKRLMQGSKNLMSTLTNQQITTMVRSISRILQKIGMTGNYADEIDFQRIGLVEEIL